MKNQTNYVKHAKQAFTLIELLVVISIVLVLAALLLPAVKSLKDKGNSIKCKGNMKNLGAAIASYAGANRGYYPVYATGNISWDDLLSGYDGRAPLDPTSNSAANGMLANGLDLVQHGKQGMYHCPSYENPFTATSGSGASMVRYIPRSYNINQYDRLATWGGNTQHGRVPGVAGSDNTTGATRTVFSGEPKQETWTANSRTVGQVGNPHRSIVLMENQGSPYGKGYLGHRNFTAFNPLTYRNGRVGGPTLNLYAGAHNDNLLDNFLLADGSVKEMDWHEITTRDDGVQQWVGVHWVGTMFDASSARMNIDINL